MVSRYSPAFFCLCKITLFPGSQRFGEPDICGSESDFNNRSLPGTASKRSHPDSPMIESRNGAKKSRNSSEVHCECFTKIHVLEERVQKLSGVVNDLQLQISALETTRSKGRELICPVQHCNTTFTRRDHLARHVQDLQESGNVTVNGLVKIICPVNNCSSTFSRRDRISSHIQSRKDPGHETGAGILNEKKCRQCGKRLNDACFRDGVAINSASIQRHEKSCFEKNDLLFITRQDSIRHISQTRLLCKCA